MLMEQEWKYIASTGRYYLFGSDEDRKTRVVGGEPPNCYYIVFQKGEEIGYGEGLESIEAAKAAAEAV